MDFQKAFDGISKHDVEKAKKKKDGMDECPRKVSDGCMVLNPIKFGHRIGKSIKKKGR